MFIPALTHTKQVLHTDSTKDTEVDIKKVEVDIEDAEVDSKEDDTDFQKTMVIEPAETEDEIDARLAAINALITEQESKKSVATFIEEPSLNLPAEANNTVKPEALYEEIDVLIAYQLYDEAFEMLKNARETLDDNGHLDIIELELLAYTKNVDEFFLKFEKFKDSLSKEFPEEWKKIADLNDKLIVEFLDGTNIIGFN